jgi:hypothetical protein
MPNEKRFIRNLRLTDSEIIRLRNNANACGMSQSGYLRSLLNGYKPKEKPSADFYKALKMLYSILFQMEDSGVTPELTDKAYDLMYEIEKKYIKPDRK